MLPYRMTALAPETGPGLVLAPKRLSRNRGELGQCDHAQIPPCQLDEQGVCRRIYAVAALVAFVQDDDRAGMGSSSEDASCVPRVPDCVTRRSGVPKPHAYPCAAASRSMRLVNQPEPGRKNMTSPKGASSSWTWASWRRNSGAVQADARFVVHEVVRQFVAVGGDASHEVGVALRPFPNEEEGRPGTVTAQDAQQLRSRRGVGPVIDGECDVMLAGGDRCDDP